MKPEVALQRLAENIGGAYKPARESVSARKYEKKYGVKTGIIEVSGELSRNFLDEQLEEVFRGTGYKRSPDGNLFSDIHYTDGLHAVCLNFFPEGKYVSDHIHTFYMTYGVRSKMDEEPESRSEAA